MRTGCPKRKENMAKKSRTPKTYLVNKRLREPEEDVPKYSTGTLLVHTAVPVPERLKKAKSPGRLS